MMAASPSRHFSFRFAPAYRLAAVAFGVTPGRCDVVIDPSGELRVRFGPWRLSTSLDNIADAGITGPYAFLMTAGPARLTVSNRGLTFASNGERGVQMTFREPVSGIEPTGRLRHPDLTVTLADIDGFLERLQGQVTVGTPTG